jgi:hypothetical protein
MAETGKLVIVHVKYGDLEQTFTGGVGDVWVCVNRFFGEFVPAFDVAKKLVLNVDLQKLTEECEGIVAFSPEGANLLVSRDRLTDNETLELWLLAAYVGFRLGMVGSEAVSKEYLQAKLGKDAKIVSTRLGELAKNDFVAKTADEKYRMTTFGATQMEKEILPRIKAKISQQKRF